MGSKRQKYAETKTIFFSLEKILQQTCSKHLLLIRFLQFLDWKISIQFGEKFPRKVDSKFMAAESLKADIKALMLSWPVVWFSDRQV